MRVTAAQSSTAGPSPPVLADGTSSGSSAFYRTDANPARYTLPSHECRHQGPRSHGSSAINAATSACAEQTCFYFTVFFSNNPPIFHSNRIPAELLDLRFPASAALSASLNGSATGSAVHVSDSSVAVPASTAAPLCAACQQSYWQAVFHDPTAQSSFGGLPVSPVGFQGSRGYDGVMQGGMYGRETENAAHRDGVPVASVGDFRVAAGAVDEVPQQTLQNVAFPTAFGGGVSGGANLLPRRSLPRRSPPPAVPESLSPSASEEAVQRAEETLAASTVAASQPLPTPSPLPQEQQQPPEVPPSAPDAQTTALLSVGSKEEGRLSRSRLRRDADGRLVLPPSTLNGPHALNGTRDGTMPVSSASPVEPSTRATFVPAPRSASSSSSSSSSPSPPSDTLPLTTTFSNVSTTTANLTSNSSARFQPTFPAVEWSEESKEKDNLSVREAAATAAIATADAAAAPLPSSPATAKPAAVPMRAQARVRRLRPRATEPPSQRTPIPQHEASSAPQPPPQPQRPLNGNSAAPSGFRPPPQPEVPSATAKPTASPTFAAVNAATAATPTAASARPAATTAAASAPKMRTSQPTTSPVPQPAAAAPADTVTTVAETQLTHDGPPWNMRVEEVRSARGELRYFRVILAVTFAALITSHTGMLHTMQTRNAAAALVLACPPSGLHFRFLLCHVDILRSLLNRTTEFAIRTVQRFFGLLFSPTRKPKGSQQQVLKGIANMLEAHPEACDTYRHVRAELLSALELRYPLPLLAPSTSSWVVPVLVQAAVSLSSVPSPAAASAAPAPAHARASSSMAWLTAPSSSSSATRPRRTKAATTAVAATQKKGGAALSELLYDAASSLRDFSEAFTSAFLCGLLSLTEDGVGGPGLRAQPPSVSAALGEEGGGAIMPSISSLHACTSIGGMMTPRSVPAGRLAGHAYRGSSPSNASCNGGQTAAMGDITRTRRRQSVKTPDWLQAYGAYFHGVCAPPWSHDVDDPADERDVIQISKPNYEQHLIRRDEDIYLRTNVSASTLSSTNTPILSPLTIDAESRTPIARFPRGRNGGFSTPVQGALSGAPGGYSCHSRPLTPQPTVSGTCPTVSIPAALLGNANATAHHSSVNVTPRVSALSPRQQAPLSPAIAHQPSSSAAATAAAASSPPPLSSTPSPAASTSKEDEFYLHRGRLGRTVIFTQDPTLARRLLLVAAFLWSDCRVEAKGVSRRAATFLVGNEGQRTGSERGAPSHEEGAKEAFHYKEAQRMYETAVAAGVTSADFANVPIQWVPEEFSEVRLRDLCSRFSPENTLLIVVPRQLQCRRISLRKRIAGTTVLVEQQSGKEARIRSAAFPFRCTITRQTLLQPDPTVTTLLREACSLHRVSRGVVDFAEVFRRMVEWVYWHSAASVLTKREALSAAAAAASPGTDKGGPGDGDESASNSRLASADNLAAAAGESLAGQDRSNHLRSNAINTPISMSPNSVARHPNGTTSSTTSAVSAASPVGAMERSWTADSAEELLLPGSRGGPSAAWAYTTTTPTTTNSAASPSHATRESGGRYTFPRTTAATATTTTTATSFSAAMAHTSTAVACPFSPLSSVSPPSRPTTSTLLVSHGLIQPPAAFVTPLPTSVAASPEQSFSRRFLGWFKASPPSTSSAPKVHPHPVLSLTTLSQLSAEDGGQLSRLLMGDVEQESDAIE